MKVRSFTVAAALIAITGQALADDAKIEALRESSFNTEAELAAHVWNSPDYISSERWECDNGALQFRKYTEDGATVWVVKASGIFEFAYMTQSGLERRLRFHDSDHQIILGPDQVAYYVDFTGAGEDESRKPSVGWPNCKQTR